MKIGIITAMPEETRPVLNKGKRVVKTGNGRHGIWQLRIGEHDITLFESGMGAANAGFAATALVSEKPDLMISAGFGGGVLPGLRVGDVLMADQLLKWAGTGFEKVTALFYENSDSSASFLLRGSFISCDGILNKQYLAGLLPEGVNRPVVEMETASVARVAAGHGISFIGIRAISDPWDEELGFSIKEFCDDNLRIRPLKVFITIMRRPYIIPQLIRLARNSRIAAKELGTAIERLLLELR